MVDCKQDRIQTEKLRNYIFSIEYTVIKFLHSYTFGCVEYGKKSCRKAKEKIH